MKRRPVIEIIAVTLGLLACVVGLVLFQKLRPYDAIRFDPDVAKVTPSQIREGGEITLHRDSYCNDGYDITVTRWADRFDAEGNVSASLSLPPVQFFTDKQVCLAPSVQPVVIPDYIVAVGGEPTKYRMRFVTTYSPNMFRIVSVTSYSEPFTITN